MTAFTLPRLGAIAAACALLLPGLAQPPRHDYHPIEKLQRRWGRPGRLPDQRPGSLRRHPWVAGSKAKYYKHLSAWSRLSAADNQRLLGVTGASVGAGRTLKVTADLADALLDAGYEIRIDAAVEDQRDSPAEVRLPPEHRASGPARAWQAIHPIHTV